MIDERIIDKLVDRLTNRIEQGNTYVLKQIGKNIKQIGSVSPSKRYQLAQVLKYGGNYDKIVKKLAEITNLNVRDIYDIFEEVAKKDYIFAEQFYKYRNKKYIPYEDNIELQRQVKAIANITAKEYINISKTMGFATTRNGKRTYTSLSKMYQQVIDEGIISISQGKETFDSNMSRIIKELSNSGIRQIDYASGYSRRLDSSVRMNVKEGLSSLHNEIQQQFGKEFGSDGVEISTHEFPAPDHEDIQGLQYSNEDYEKLNDKLERPIGTKNCYHYIFSIIMGVSEPNHTKKELKEIKKRNKKGFEFEGKKYTMYEGTQLQRRLETEMRKEQDMQIMAKASLPNAKQEDLPKIKNKILESQKTLKQLTESYIDLSRVSGLSTRLERTRVSGYKRTKVAK